MMTDELMSLLSVKLSLATFLLSLATTSNCHLTWLATTKETYFFLRLKSYSKSIKIKRWSIFTCLYFVLLIPSQLIVEARFFAFDKANNLLSGTSDEESDAESSFELLKASHMMPLLIANHLQ